MIECRHRRAYQLIKIVYYKNAINQIDPFHYVTKEVKIVRHAEACCKITDFHTACETRKKTGPQFQPKLRSDILWILRCSHNAIHTGILSIDPSIGAYWLRAKFCVFCIMREVLVQKLDTYREIRRRKREKKKNYPITKRVKNA